MTPEQIQQLIAQGETLTLEFKGEERAPLNDRANVAELCGLSDDQASRLPARMVATGKLVRSGSPPRWVHYSIPGGEK